MGALVAACSGPITEVLSAARRGDGDARERLWTVVYDELRSIAAHQMAIEAPNRTLQPTALVHEAYLRLLGEHPIDWTNRCLFFAAAAKMMRRIRIDDARRRNRLKRGGDRRRVPLDGAEDAGGLGGHRACFDDDPAEALAIDEALRRLEALDPQMAEVVVLRYHGGLTREQISEAVGIAPRTVDNKWRLARAWLWGQLAP